GDGILDDEKGGAVFDRLAGIEEFGLAENLATGLFGSAIEADQRRIADRADDIFANAGHAGDPKEGSLRLQECFFASLAHSSWRKQGVMWSLTMPMAWANAYTITGPQKLKPRCFNSLARAWLISVSAGIWSMRLKRFC